MEFFENPLADRGPLQAHERRIVSLDTAHTALVEMRRWPGYAPTPLRSLQPLARQLKLGSISYKDESERFSLGSFKALGGAYAAGCELRRRLSMQFSIDASLAEVFDGAYPEQLRSFTLCCATDGNHGLSVASAAQRIGCACVVFMHGERGTVEIIDGKTYRTEKSVKLRPHADAIAYDPASQYLYVVNGGADAKMTHTVISVVDTVHGATVGEIEVAGDSLEAMALEKASPIMYVDNRAKNEVEVINRQTHEMVATWPVTLGKTMVALVLDEASHRLFVGCRDGSIVVFDVLTGKELQALSIGMGIDDLVFDAASKRIYAACGGSGTVDVYEEVDADHYRSLGQIPSGPLARNGLLIPSLKQYFVAVPKSANKPARVLVYQVQ